MHSREEHNSDEKFAKRALIEQARARVKFRRIPTLFFVQESVQPKDYAEVFEFCADRGFLVTSYRLATTIVAGNRVANTGEIWLYPDGTLHEYLESITWESFEEGCSQRLYVGPVDEQRISLEELEERIEFNIADDEDDSDDEVWPS